MTRFLFDEEITSIQIVKPAANPAAPQGLAGPADRDHAHRVRQARRRRAVRHHRCRLRGAHRGRRREGQRDDRSRRRRSSARRHRARWGGQITPGFKERFGQAYDTEIQRWVDAVHGRGTEYIDGPARGTATPRPRSARPASSRSTPASPSRSRWSTALRSREPDMKIALDPDAVSPRLRAARLPARGGGSRLRAPAADAASRLHPVLQPPARRRRPGRQVPQVLRRRGRGIASVLPVLRWSGPDEDAREAAVRNWKRVIQITVDLGVNVINTEFSGRPEKCRGIRAGVLPVDGGTGADLRTRRHRRPDRPAPRRFRRGRAGGAADHPRRQLAQHRHGLRGLPHLPHGRQHDRDHARRRRQAAAGACRRHDGPPPQPRAALHHQPAGQPGPGAPAPQDRRRRRRLGRVLRRPGRDRLL